MGRRVAPGALEKGFLSSPRQGPDTNGPLPGPVVSCLWWAAFGVGRGPLARGRWHWQADQRGALPLSGPHPTKGLRVHLESPAPARTPTRPPTSVSWNGWPGGGAGRCRARKHAGRRVSKQPLRASGHLELALGTGGVIKPERSRRARCTEDTWRRARRASRHGDSPPRPTPGIGFQRPTGLWWVRSGEGKALSGSTLRADGPKPLQPARPSGQSLHRAYA